MKLKIISDGTPLGSKIIHADTGELLEGVYGISWETDIHSIPKAILRIHLAAAEIELKDFNIDIQPVLVFQKENDSHLLMEKTSLGHEWRTYKPLNLKS